MRATLLEICVVVACGCGAGATNAGGGTAGADAGVGTGGGGSGGLEGGGGAGGADLGAPDLAPACPMPADPIKDVYDAVDATKLAQRLKELSGVVPVSIGGNQVSLTERYSPAAKTKWREYAKQYFASLGLNANEMAYPTQHMIGETMGHNLEVVVPGKSADSVVVIVHYDSIGPAGQEASNPGVDDDMTGMAALFEAARVLSDPCRRAADTIRFVAADYEEQGNPGLEGARAYASYLEQLSTSQGFKLVGAQDYEQSGWNCAIDNACGGVPGGSTYYVVSCSGSSDGNMYSFPAMGDALAALTTKYSPLKVSRVCVGAESDHYAMWEIGVPAVVTSEYGNNPRFDQTGGDTFARIDLAYHAQIARIAIAFTAQLAGIGK